MMIGIEGCGKTYMLYDIKEKNEVKQLNDVGINHKNLVWNNFSIDNWDLTANVIKSFEKPFIEKAKGIIFVLDSNNNEEFPVVVKEFTRFMANPALEKRPVFILANNQSEDSMSLEYISKGLGLESLNTRKHHIVITGYNGASNTLKEGLKWIDKAIKDT